MVIVSLKLAGGGSVTVTVKALPPQASIMARIIGITQATTRSFTLVEMSYMYIYILLPRMMAANLPIYIGSERALSHHCVKSITTSDRGKGCSIKRVRELAQELPESLY